MFFIQKFYTMHVWAFPLWLLRCLYWSRNETDSRESAGGTSKRAIRVALFPTHFLNQKTWRKSMNRKNTDSNCAHF